MLNVREDMKMTPENLLEIFTQSKKPMLGTSEIYDIARKKYHVDDLYDDYEKHIRGLQQTLKKQGLIENVMYGYWALTAR